MRIIIITQNEPFYLAENIRYLFDLLPPNITVVGVVLYEPSPFGKKKSFWNKALSTIKIFGINFFLFYALQFLKIKLGNKPTIKSFLRRNKINIINLKNSINNRESLKIIESYKPDLLVSILGNEIFKKDLLKIAPLGCINLHSSLLPKYRGLLPTFWILKNKEKLSGVSVFFVDEGIDSGQIIIQKKFSVDNLTHRGLIIKSKKVGMEAIADAITAIVKNRLTTIPNKNNESTYYKFPNRNDVKKFLKSGAKFF